MKHAHLIETLPSLSFLRSKIYGNKLSALQIEKIISDITLGKYSAVQISAFLTACASSHLDEDEIFYLTKAMIKMGEKINWHKAMIVDKHSIGGIPGNRTTPIIVAIVADYGLTMPKTSSRAITSPAGTADTMEVLTEVDLNIEKIQKIVAQENACIVWGGSSSLSPTDDILIHVERELNLDSEEQMVASILSKKIAAGSNHILIEIPTGKTAKVRNKKTALLLQKLLEKIGKKLGVKVKALITDGSQPIGFGIGPALEARDLVAVLKNDKNAPQDLRNHALNLAAEILEFSPEIKKGSGKIIAKKILDSGKAWEKFQAICEAQGGLKKIPQAKYVEEILAQKSGMISEIDNRQIAILAKLAGAPFDRVAGIDLYVKTGQKIKQNQVLFTIHSQSKNLLKNALNFCANNSQLIQIK